MIIIKKKVKYFLSLIIDSITGKNLMFSLVISKNKRFIFEPITSQQIKSIVTEMYYFSVVVQSHIPRKPVFLIVLHFKVC